jgi:transposase
VAKQIAEKANVSRATVERVMRVQKADPAAFERIAAGERAPRRLPGPKRETWHAVPWALRVSARWVSRRAK